MSGTLTGFVHLHDGDGVACVFGPDDDVPAWAVAQITNPAAWADGTSPQADSDGPPRPRRGRPPKQRTDDE